MLESLKRVGRALDSSKGNAIFNGIMSLGWVFICAISLGRGSQTWLIPMCAFNAAVFAFSAGSSLMRHVCDGLIRSQSDYIDVLEADCRELRSEIYGMLGLLDVKQDLTEVPLSDEP